MRKAIMLLLMLVFMLVPSVTVADYTDGYDAPSATLAWRYTMLGERILTRRQVGLDIRGTVPYICSTFVGSEYINRHIDDEVVTSLVSEARRLRARAVTFGIGGYHPTEDVISVVIFADVATTLPHTLVRSVNFCAHTGEILTMNEAVGMEIKPLAERILTEKIRSNPERYYAALNSEVPDAFYLTSERLVILFDGFALSTRVNTPDTLTLTLANIRTLVLTEREYRHNGPYGLKMIPIATTARRLGFRVHWVQPEYDGNDFVMITRGGSNIVMLTPGDNEYVIHGTQRRSLEAAPQLIFNRFVGENNTYVPITFFDHILPNTSYTIDWDGSITFLAYFED